MSVPAGEGLAHGGGGWERLLASKGRNPTLAMGIHPFFLPLSQPVFHLLDERHQVLNASVSQGSSHGVTEPRSGEYSDVPTACHQSWEAHLWGPSGRNPRSQALLVLHLDQCGHRNMR